MLGIPIPPWVYAGAAALTLAAGFAGGWSVRDWKADADQIAAREKADQLADGLREKANGASGQFEGLAADNRQAGVITTNTIREVYRNVEVPANCAAAPDAVSLLDNARERANAATTGQSGPALPAPAATAAAPDRP